MINIHIYFGNNTPSSIDIRKMEYEALANSIYPEICKCRYGDFRAAYTIAMGDTSTSKYANNYDHFTYSPELSPFKLISCEAVDVAKYCDLTDYWDNVSDHKPIVMAIEI